MKWQLADMDGHVTASGEGDPPDEVPDHGSVSIAVAPGRWVSFLTSEWLSVYVSDRPITWPDTH